MVLRRTPVPTETQECIAYWQWVQNVPVLREYIYKIVNEGKRSVVQGSNLKKIGLRRGLPDYHYPVNNGTYNGLWIEMKRRNCRTKILPDHQKEWIDKLIQVNHYAIFAFGWEDAANITLRYINNNL
jgi:hypothetical protein